MIMSKMMRGLMGRSSRFQVRAAYPFLGLDDHEMMNRLITEAACCKPTRSASPIRPKRLKRIEDGEEGFDFGGGACVTLFWRTDTIEKAKTIALNIRKANIPTVQVKVSAI